MEMRSARRALPSCRDRAQRGQAATSSPETPHGIFASRLLRNPSRGVTAADDPHRLLLARYTRSSHGSLTAGAHRCHAIHSSAPPQPSDLHDAAPSREGAPPGAPSRAPPPPPAAAAAKELKRRRLLF